MSLITGKSVDWSLKTVFIYTDIYSNEFYSVFLHYRKPYLAVCSTYIQPCLAKVQTTRLSYMHACMFTMAVASI